MELKRSEAAPGGDVEEIEIDLYGDLSSFVSSPSEELNDVERIVVGSAAVGDSPSVGDGWFLSAPEATETPSVFSQSAPGEAAGKSENEPDQQPITLGEFVPGGFAPESQREAEPASGKEATREEIACPSLAEPVAMDPGADRPAELSEGWGFTEEAVSLDPALELGAEPVMLDPLPNVFEAKHSLPAADLEPTPADSPVLTADNPLPAAADQLPTADSRVLAADSSLATPENQLLAPPFSPPTADMLGSLDQITEKLEQAEESLSAIVGEPVFDFSGDQAPIPVIRVCSACGVESALEDLLCIACGAFLGELGDEPPSGPICVECGLSVIPEEVFCPSCGSVVGD